MVKFGKWLGGGLGWVVGGPIGLLLGFVVGSVVDSTVVIDSGAVASSAKRTTSGAFNVSLTVLIAAILKSDGKVLKSELDYVKKFLVSQFGKEAASEAIRMLRDVLKQEIPVRDVCFQIRKNMDYASRLQLLQLLFNISLSDGDIHKAEQELIQIISGYLNISSSDYLSIKNMFVPETDSSFKILEIDTSASDDDIKSAYRKMAKKYHPDKVAHLGEDHKKSAEEKFKKVNDAYNRLKNDRGFN